MSGYRLPASCLVASLHGGEQSEGVGSLVTLTQALIPPGAPPLVAASDPNRLPKAHLLIPLHWRVGLQHTKGAGWGKRSVDNNEEAGGVRISETIATGNLACTCGGGGAQVCGCTCVGVHGWAALSNNIHHR